MSTTETTTETSSPPELTSLLRVASIPLIQSSFETINGALLNNAYTRAPYTAAKNISTSAVKFTEPLQIRLAPLIVQTDGYVNKGLDAVQEKFPYPFEAKPEEVVTFVRERRQSVTEFATKAFDDKVKSPAYSVVQGIDQRFAPLVDYFESAVTHLPGSTNGAGPSTPPDAKYQYQRALALSKNATGNLYVYSTEQLKQLQEHNALVQHATETAQSIANLATSSVTSAQTRVNNLSDSMIAQLQKLQNSSKDLSVSLSESLQHQAQNLPIPSGGAIHEIYAEFADNLSSTITELRGIAADDAPWSEKVTRIGHEVSERVSPLLETIRTRAAELLPRAKEAASTTAGDQPANGTTETETEGATEI